MMTAANQTGLFFSSWSGSSNSTLPTLAFTVNGDSKFIANYQLRHLVSMVYTNSRGISLLPSSTVVLGPYGFEALGPNNSTLWFDANTNYSLVSAQVMGVNVVPLNQASASFAVTKPETLTFALSVYPVQLRLVDIFGQPIKGVQIELTTEGGQVIGAVTDGNGVANYDAVPSGWFEATYSFLGVSGQIQNLNPGQHFETVTLALSYPLISVGLVFAGVVAISGVAWRRQRNVFRAFE